MSQKPPLAETKERPTTSGNPRGFFYQQSEAGGQSVKSGNHEIISLSVDRNQLKLGKTNTNPGTVQSRTSQGSGHILDKYQIGKPIGQGAYATVYVCYNKYNMRKYAIKIYQKVKLNDSMKRKAVQREIMSLKKIDHPHIIKMYDLIETSKQICIVTDYIAGISLH